MRSTYFCDVWVWLCVFTLAANNYCMSSYYLFYSVLGKIELQKKYIKLILFSRKEKYYSCWISSIAMLISKGKISIYHRRNLGSRVIRLEFKT